jgi:hypothetical protein
MPDLTIDSCYRIYISRQQFHSPIQSGEITSLHLLWHRKRHHLQTKIVIPKMKSQDFISLMACLPIFKECKPRGLLIINWILSSIKTNPTNSFLTAIWERKFKNNKIWRSESNQTGEFVYRAIIKKVLQRPVLVGLSNQLYSDRTKFLRT